MVLRLGTLGFIPVAAQSLLKNLAILKRIVAPVSLGIEPFREERLCR